MGAGAVTLFLCGDVMLGRGVDQILPHPGDPALRESYVLDARTYVELAEEATGPIPRRADYAYPWGDALGILDEVAPEVRVVNLETSVTRSDRFAPGKAVNYRMNPANLPALAVVRPDACALANNHVLDFGREGLAETLGTLAATGIAATGAGRDLDEARRPVIVPLAGDGRVLVFSFGMESSGIPPTWAASDHRAGVHLVPESSEHAAREITERVRKVRRPGDIAVASIHWGSNWGYQISRADVRFAHALIDGGVDIVHGHSSHHPRPIELYQGRLVLYGCGDLINDYEGIRGYEEFRDDLRLLYFASIDRDSGRLTQLRMTPMQSRRMRLCPAAPHDVEWLRATLDEFSGDFGARVYCDPDGMFVPV
ncbi:CapA family protein [Sphaerimonospora sp. CA-214678]|uniref:CapA family protein n=1 Tax=Sphaerimonospora sp. CA-214678 TaxID=3240029 RepID=UPI003D8D550E